MEIWLGVVAHPCHLKLMQEDHHEVEGSLDYVKVPDQPEL